MDLSFLPDTLQRRILAMCTEDGDGTPRQAHTLGSRLQTDTLHGQLPTAPPMGADRRSPPPSLRSLCDQPIGDAHSGGTHASAQTRQSSTTLPDMRRGGLAVLDAFIPQSDVEVASQQLQEALLQQQRAAGMGGAAGSKWHDYGKRGDIMRWLHVDEERTAGRTVLADLMQSIADLRQQLERMGFDVGGRVTFQAACYPGGGSRYVRHADASHSAPGRSVTAVMYLNNSWNAAVSGGQLAVYNTPHVVRSQDPDFAMDRNGSASVPTANLALPDVAVLVSPSGGRLVLFESTVEHEVLPCNANRYALTTWFYKRTQDTDVVRTPAASLGRLHGVARKEFNADVPSVPPVPGGLLRTWPQDDGSATAGPTIFVSIASYRDPETRWTIRDLFTKVDAHEAAELTAPIGTASGTLPEWMARVREVRLPAAEAEGPLWARFLAQKLWHGEDFVMQLDAHCRFADGWDDICLQQLLAAEEIQNELGLTDAASRPEAATLPKVVLSTYPSGYDGSGPAAATPDIPNTPVALLCASHFDSDGLLRLVSRTLRSRPGQPLPSRFWAAGFSFSRAALLQEVPYPSDLPHLFFGEEVYMLARMWTRGWHVWAPCQPVLFHQWERRARMHTFQADGWSNDEERKLSQQKVLAVLGAACWPFSSGTGLPGPSGPDSQTALPPGWRPGEVWGLGTAHSLEAFEGHVGVSFSARSISASAEFGGLGADAFDKGD